MAPIPEQSQDANLEVPGPVVFWALLAIILNTMAQSSSTASYLRGPRYSEGLLTPWLSSPIFCTTDICIDLYRISVWLLTFLTRGLSGGVIQPSQLVIIRTILIIFGVMPQAVKLYGMSGVPWTQALATIYLVAALTRLLGTITCGNHVIEVIDTESVLFAKIWLFLLHTAAYIPLWNDISKAFKIERTSTTYQNLHQAIMILRFFSNVAILLLALAGIIFIFSVVPALRRSRLRQTLSSKFDNNKVQCAILFFAPQFMFDLSWGSLELITDPPSFVGGLEPDQILAIFIVRLIPLLVLPLLSSWILARLIILITLGFSLFIAQAEDTNDQVTNTEPLDELGLTFVILNLITAWTWYSFAWNSAGTAIPSWGGWLG